MRDHLKFVAVGHVDHGKSTLIGRLLYDTNSLPPDKMDEVRMASEENDGVPEFAFVMDHLEEERRNRVTIDTAQIFFKTAKREYVIIDAPGHKQFLKNMITGSTQAEAALLLVAAEEGLQEQTHRHAYMLSLLGIRQLLIVINKMDLVNYDQQRFEQIKKDITKRLEEFGMEPPLMTIPIVSTLGENVARRSDKMDWYDGMTLLEGLDQLQPAPSAQNGRLRFPVQDIYELEGEKVLVGRLASGTLRNGQDIMFHPLGKTATVDYIKVFGASKDQAIAGESIGIVLKNKNAMQGLARGEVACDLSPSPHVHNTIVATVFWMNGEPLRKDETIDLKCATRQVSCKVKKITDRMNSSTLEIIATDAKDLHDTEVAKLTLKADGYVCMDPFESVAETGRFVLMRDNDTVAGGILH